MGDKTLAMRLLEGKKVGYDVATYPAEIKDAEEVAAQVGRPPASVFKTLVVDRAPEKPLLVMVPADRQLDLKKLAQAVGAKKLKMATQERAESLTGLQVGGISPLALLNKGFVIYCDASARDQETLCISAGQRGLQIIVPTRALLQLTRARLVDVT